MGLAFLASLILTRLRRLRIPLVFGEIMVGVRFDLPALLVSPIPGDVLVLAIRRNGELFVPHGYNRLERGDHVTLLGEIDSVAVEWLQSDGLSPPCPA